MTFKTGDRVRVTRLYGCPDCAGLTGTVVSIRENLPWPYRVRIDKTHKSTDGGWYMREVELEKIDE